MVKNSPVSAGDTGSIPGPGRSQRASEQINPPATTIDLCSRALELQPPRPVHPRACAPQDATAGPALVGQWLRLCTPNAGALGSILGQGTRSHVPQLRFCMPQLKIPRVATKNQRKRVWRKGNPLTLLVGVQTSTATMENSVEVP